MINCTAAAVAGHRKTFKGARTSIRAGTDQNRKQAKQTQIVHTASRLSVTNRHVAATAVKPPISLSVARLAARGIIPPRFGAMQHAGVPNTVLLYTFYRTRNTDYSKYNSTGTYDSVLHM